MKFTMPERSPRILEFSLTLGIAPSYHTSYDEKSNTVPLFSPQFICLSSFMIPGSSLATAVYESDLIDSSYRQTSHWLSGCRLNRGLLVVSAITCIRNVECSLEVKMSLVNVCFIDIEHD